MPTTKGECGEAGQDGAAIATRLFSMGLPEHLPPSLDVPE
jgi:hypothetical protein